MSKDDITGIIILLSIICIALFGGAKNVTKTGVNPGSEKTTAQKQADIQNQIIQAQFEADNIKRQIQIEEDKKTASVYKNIVDLVSINRSGNSAAEEYAYIHVNNAKNPINVTGWTLKSRASGAEVKIPKGTYLFQSGMINSNDDIYLNTGETLYLSTGISPNGASFKVNKCSGYLSQFQTFIPYLYTFCPRPGDENLGSIPKTTNNDACLDYIQRFPSCRIQTENLPTNWSYECTNFIYTKINYPSCISTHRNDPDFFGNEWRVYLGRSERLWKDSREEIVLIDNEGKIVDTLKY